MGQQVQVCVRHLKPPAPRAGRALRAAAPPVRRGREERAGSCRESTREDVRQTGPLPLGLRGHGNKGSGRRRQACDEEHGHECRVHRHLSAPHIAWNKLFFDPRFHGASIRGQADGPMGSAE